MTLNFNEAVTGITPNSTLLVAEVGFGQVVPGTWACTTKSAAATPCRTGHVRHAAFTPDNPFPPSALVILILNPSGSLGIRDFGGNPFRQDEFLLHTGPT